MVTLCIHPLTTENRITMDVANKLHLRPHITDSGIRRTYPSNKPEDSSDPFAEQAEQHLVAVIRRADTPNDAEWLHSLITLSKRRPLFLAEIRIFVALMTGVLLLELLYSFLSAVQLVVGGIVAYRSKLALVITHIYLLCSGHLPQGVT